MEEALAYLEEDLLGQYLELLPSRWAALLPRLVKRTQRLQLSSAADVAATRELERAIDDDLQLVAQLLQAEHKVYEGGVWLMKRLGDDVAAAQHAWRLLASDLLTELAMKEAVVAHWKTALHTIAADTLRVYTHALLVHSRVTKARVHHVMELMRADTSGESG
ncbi:hypothetical protein NESM_000733700 [Novymonas esmeraldas]|uniref:Uncharacterized protein n=1 Tax=Novymonas esmeraldas TaxID=1808958 RepID=A0AAW0EW21_9TRYP